MFSTTATANAASLACKPLWDHLLTALHPGQLLSAAQVFEANRTLFPVWMVANTQQMLFSLADVSSWGISTGSINGKVCLLAGNLVTYLQGRIMCWFALTHALTVTVVICIM